MKPCTKCGTAKPLEEFPKQKRNRDGRDSRCKACAAAHVKQYVEANKEKVAASKRAAYLRNKTKIDAYVKAWHQANKEARSEHRKKWRDSNYEKARSVEKASYQKNRDAELERRRRYAKANRARYTSYVQKRKAAKLNATPVWADFEKIAQVYEQANLLSTSTGVVHHVDHIVPLQSPEVCGLHVHYNLRPIPAVENRRKFNKVLADDLVK